MKEMILASGSPRRKELVQLLPWSFKVCVKAVDETIDKNLSVRENVKALALKKAMAVAKEHSGQIVIGADTMVCLDGEMMGKPQDTKMAEEMLKSLSGRRHQVLSGVAVVHLEQNKQYVFCEETIVKMQVLTDKEIQAYIQTGEPMDKAGSYAIQGIGARYIEGIEGDYFNVVGLPIHRIYQVLSEIIADLP